MKFLQLIHFSIIITLIPAITSCTNFGENQSVKTTSMPPQNTTLAAVSAPEPGHEENIDNERVIKNNESQEFTGTKITEERYTGGSLEKITVDSSKDLPDYYLFPPQKPEQNDLPNQNMSLPTWQISW